jgi:hypothetical protein
MMPGILENNQNQNQNCDFLEFPSTQISITPQIFDFMSGFCREFFADSNATSKYSFFYV